MLIITRRPGEKIMLGDDIVDPRDGDRRQHASASASRPRKSLPVYREEIWAAVKEENQASARAEAARMPQPATDAGARV